MAIKQTITTNNECYQCNIKLDVKGIMLHSVGCAQPDASVFVKQYDVARPNGQVAVHAFIDARTGDVYQTLPWAMKAWHAGGSANATHIGIEMCESSGIKYMTPGTFQVTDANLVKKQAKTAYDVAVKLFASLCKHFKLDPLKDGVIISHHEGYQRGVASNHGDPEHYWGPSGTGYTMDQFRKDVKASLDKGDVFSDLGKIESEGAITAASTLKITPKEIAAETYNIFVNLKPPIEGEYNSVTCDTDGGLAIGYCQWNTVFAQADRLFNGLGLSKYCGEKLYKDFGSAAIEEIKKAVDTSKAMEVEKGMVTEDVVKWLKMIVEGVPELTDSKTLVFANAWMPANPTLVVNFLSSNLSDINNNLDSIYKIFVDRFYIKAGYSNNANVKNSYATRSKRIYEYLKKIKDSELGKESLDKFANLDLNSFANSILGSASDEIMFAIKSRNIAHGKHSDIIFESPKKLYCEPVYPDLVCINDELPASSVADVLSQAKQNEIIEVGNLEYKIPKETARQYGGIDYYIQSIKNDAIQAMRSQEFDYNNLTQKIKIPNGGKPSNDKDPFPIDSKIKEFEEHQPRCKIEQIQTCPEAKNVTKECIKLSMNTERRLVRLENNISTILRYLQRIGARVPINCVFFGGHSIYKRYECIRCLKDNRLEDGQLMTLDQCLNCTRFEPLIGQVYDITNKSGLNLSEVLDNCQMSYMTTEEYMNFAQYPKRQKRLNSVEFDPSATKTRKTGDDATDFQKLWKPEQGVKMNWHLVPVENQLPSINGETEVLDSNVGIQTNAGYNMTTASIEPNIFTDQISSMDALKESDFGYTCVNDAKTWVSDHGKQYVEEMKAQRSHDIIDFLNKNKDCNFDNLLIAAIGYATDQDYKNVVPKITETSKKLQSAGTKNKLLVVDAYVNTIEDIIGKSTDEKNKDLPARLDKVEKKIKNEDGGGNA